MKNISSLLKHFNDYLKILKMFLSFQLKYPKVGTFKNCYEMFARLSNYTFEDLLSKNGIQKMYSTILNFPCDGQEFLLNFVSENYIKKHANTVRILDAIFWVC